MPRRGRGRQRRGQRSLDQLELGERRLALIERLAIDIATVLWLIASLIVVVFVGALRVEATFLTGLTLGLRMRH